MQPLSLIDELAANAWPAPVCQHAGSWVLRYGWGATRRANSAWPRPEGATDLAARIDHVVRAYEAWSAPPRVQVTGELMPGLDDELAGRGWAREGACHVMAVDLATLCARSAACADLELAPTPDADWIDAWWSAGRGGAAPAAAARIVGQPLPRAVHGRRVGPEGWACVGRGVCERGWLGIFALATHPARRGRGHARAVVGGLSRWARELGAHSAYLQVEVDNSAAISLFERLGFTAIGGYHYRTLVR